MADTPIRLVLSIEGAQSTVSSAGQIAEQIGQQFNKSIHEAVMGLGNDFKQIAASFGAAFGGAVLGINAHLQLLNDNIARLAAGMSNFGGAAGRARDNAESLSRTIKGFSIQSFSGELPGSSSLDPRIASLQSAISQERLKTAQQQVASIGQAAVAPPPASTSSAVPLPPSEDEELARTAARARQVQKILEMRNAAQAGTAESVPPDIAQASGDVSQTIQNAVSRVVKNLGQGALQDINQKSLESAANLGGAPESYAGLYASRYAAERDARNLETSRQYQFIGSQGQANVGATSAEGRSIDSGVTDEQRRAMSQQNVESLVQAGKYSGVNERDNLESRVNALYESIASVAARDAEAATAAQEEAAAKVDAIRVGSGRNAELRGYYAADRASGDIRSLVASVNQESMPKVTGTDQLGEVVGPTLDRRRAEAANAAAKFSPQDNAEELADQLTSSILTYAKREGGEQEAAQKAAVKISAAADKVAQKEYDGILAGIEELGKQTAVAGKEIGAQQLAQAVARLRQTHLEEAAQYVSTGGTFTAPFRQTSQTTDEEGQVTSQKFSRPAGIFRDAQTVNVDSVTGKWKVGIEEMTSTWARFEARTLGTGGVVSQSINGMLIPVRLLEGAIGKVDAVWNSVGNNLIRISALFYSVERVGNLLKDIFVGPYEAIVNATEAAKKFEMAISGIAGGADRAHVIDDQIVKVSKDIPLTIAQIRELTIEMTKVSALSGNISGGSAAEVGQRIAENAKMISSLVELNPDKTPTEITKSLQQILEGRSMSMRGTLSIDPADLARMAGKTPKELGADPEAMLRALKDYLAAYAPTGGGERGQLVSVQVEKLKDQYDNALAQIGNSGIYNVILARVNNLMSTIAGYLDPAGGRFGPRAKELADSLGKVFDGVGNSMLVLVQKISGSNSPADSIDAFVGQLSKIAGAIGRFADGLPAWADKIGDALASIGKGMSSVYDNATQVVNSKGEVNPVAMAVQAPLATSATVASFALDGARYLGMLKTAAIMLGVSPSHFELTGSNGNASLPGIGLADGGPKAMQVSTEKKLSDSQRLLEGIDKGMMVDSKVNGPTNYYLGHFGDQESELAKIAPEPSQGNSAIGAFDTANRALTGAGMTAGPQNLFLQIDKFYETAVSVLGSAIEELQAKMDTDEAVDPSIISGLDEAIAIHGRQVAQQIAASIKATTEGVGDFGVELTTKLKGSGDLYISQISDMFMAGETSPQLRAIQALITGNQPDAAAKLKDGLSTMKPEYRTGFIDQSIQSHLNIIKNSGYSAGSSFLTGEGTDAQQLSYLQNAGLPIANRNLSNAQGSFAAAQAAFKLSPNDANAEDLEETRKQMDQATESVQKLEREMQNLQIASNRGLEAVLSFGNQIQSTMEKSLGDVFDSLITKTNNLREVLSNFGKSIASDFSQQVSHMLVSSIAGDPAKGGGLGGIVSSFLSGNGANLGGVAGWLYRQFNQPTPATINTEGYAYGGAVSGGTVVGPGDVSYGAADGAIFRGGFMPFQAFSSGGIARKPTMGIVGEGGADEAIIPMHGGRIPLKKDANGGIHAVLPGNGRSIPTAFFAQGGIAAGGFGGSGFDAGAASSGAFGGSGGGGNTEVHVYNVANIQEAMANGYRGMSNQLLNNMLNEARPGGKFRRVLAKPV